MAARSLQPRSLPSDASAPPRSFAAGALPPGEILSMTCGSRLASAPVVSCSPIPAFFASSATSTLAEHLARPGCRDSKILSRADP